MPTAARLLTFVCLMSLAALPAGQAVGQTLTDTLGGAAIQQELQGQQANPSGAEADDAGDSGADEARDVAAEPDTSQAGDSSSTRPRPGAAANAAQAQSVMLMSVFKPLLVALLLGGWGWVVTRLDKDAAYYHQPRHLWNLGQIGAALAGLALLLLIPYFFLGLLLMVLTLGGTILAYAWYRNQRVPEDRKWTLDIKSFSQRMEDYHQSQAQRRATISLINHENQPQAVPREEDREAVAHDAMEDMFDFALPRNAERIELAVDSKQAAVAVRIDGVKYPQPPLDPALALKVVDYVKEAAGLDVSDRRKKQLGQFRVDAQELGGHRIDVETAGSTRGVALTMAIDAHQRSRVPMEKLGMLESQRKALVPLLETRGMVVLVTAPPRHGLSTTLFSMLQTHDPYTTSITAYTEEPASDLEGISHKQLPEGMPAQEYNEQLATLLRSDPDVVLVSRLADNQTARLLTQNSEHGRFYVPMQMDDTFEALKAWVKLVGEHRAAADALGAITAQRLIRKLCTVCRTPYTPDPAALKKLNLPADKVKQLYHASGKVMTRDRPEPCPSCFGLGYRGRTGVFEVMVLDDPARDLIANNQLDRLRAHLRKQRMLWLQEAALAKLAYEGSTDIKEITRVLGDKFGAGGAGGRSGTPVAGGGNGGGGNDKTVTEVKQG